MTTAIEHPSVLEPMRQLEKEGFEVVFLTPDADGRVPEEAVLKAVTGDTILISVMAVNNELGSIQPIEVLKKAGETGRARRRWFMWMGFRLTASFRLGRRSWGSTC